MKIRVRYGYDHVHRRNRPQVKASTFTLQALSLQLVTGRVTFFGEGFATAICFIGEATPTLKKGVLCMRHIQLSSRDNHRLNSGTVPAIAPPAVQHMYIVTRGMTIRIHIAVAELLIGMVFRRRVHML